MGGYTKRKCDNCPKEYWADNRNLSRGWGLCCSKSCAASKREKSKSGYNAARVQFNNYRRQNWNANILDKGFGDICLANVEDGARFQGRTSEGYRVYDGVAYDEWGEAFYRYDPNEDDRGWDNHK